MLVVHDNQRLEELTEWVRNKPEDAAWRLMTSESVKEEQSHTTWEKKELVEYWIYNNRKALNFEFETQCESPRVTRVVKSRREISYSNVLTIKFLMVDDLQSLRFKESDSIYFKSPVNAKDMTKVLSRIRG